MLSGIKPRLIEPLLKTSGCWLDEIPAVLWGLRTTPNRSTGYTPFFLVYGAEAVLPTDIQYDSPRVALYCSAPTFNKVETPVLSASPWITASTTVQNIKYNCRSIKIYYIEDPDLVNIHYYLHNLKASFILSSTAEIR